MSFTCSICLECPPQQPVILCPDEHVVCKAHLQELANQGSKCPECEVYVPDITQLKVSRMLNNIAEDTRNGYPTQSQVPIAVSVLTKVLVKNIENHIREYDVNENLTVAMLKLQVGQKEGLSLEQMRLICKGKNLQDEKTLVECNIRDKEMLHLVKRYKGGASSKPEPSAKQRQTKSLAPHLAHNISRSTDLGNVGLANIGNTCYMNSAVQGLRALREFILDLRSMGKSEPLLRKLDHRSFCQVYKCTIELLDEMDSRGDLNQSVSPEKLKSAVAQKVPRFRGNHQHDAHEFLQEYINVLQNDLLTAVIGHPPEWQGRVVKLQSEFPHIDKSILVQVLQQSNGVGAKALTALRDLKVADGHIMQNGTESEKPSACVPGLATETHLRSQIQTILTCTQCGFSQASFENAYDLSLDFPAAGARSCKLEELVKTHFSHETCTASCENCRMETRHVMQKRLTSAPRALVLHIKRNTVGVSARLNSPASHQTNHLEIPSVLPLQERCLERYALRAVVARSGQSWEYGHYVCHAVDAKGNWKIYDDDHVATYGKEVAKSLGHHAHIIFYVKECAQVAGPTRTPREKKARQLEGRTQAQVMPQSRDRTSTATTFEKDTFASKRRGSGWFCF